MVTLEEVKKLPPKERIAKLKEMEEERKAEIKEAEKMIRASQDEVIEEEKKDLSAAAAMADADVKQEKAPENLEDALEGEEKKLSPEEETAHKQYLNQLAMAPHGKLNERVDYLKEVKQEFGYLNQNQQQEAHNLLYAMNEKQKAAKTGSYNTSDIIMENITDDKKWLDDLMGYKRGFAP